MSIKVLNKQFSVLNNGFGDSLNGVSSGKCSIVALKESFDNQIKNGDKNLFEMFLASLNQNGHTVPSMNEIDDCFSTFENLFGLKIIIAIFNDRFNLIDVQYALPTSFEPVQNLSGSIIIGFQQGNGPVGHYHGLKPVDNDDFEFALKMQLQYQQDYDQVMSDHELAKQLS